MTPPPDRLRALARVGANIRRWYCDWTENIAPSGHAQPFETCPHPDCEAVREAPPQEQTDERVNGK